MRVPAAFSAPMDTRPVRLPNSSAGYAGSLAVLRKGGTLHDRRNARTNRPVLVSNGPIRWLQQLYTYDLESGALTRLQHPGGSFWAAYFTPHGDIFAQWEDATHPTRLSGTLREEPGKSGVASIDRSHGQA